MSDETPNGGQAAPPRRLPAKLWVAGGAVALSSALAGGFVVWLFTPAPVPAKPPRAAAAGGDAPAASAPAGASAAVADAPLHSAPAVHAVAAASAAPPAGEMSGAQDDPPSDLRGGPAGASTMAAAGGPTTIPTAAREPATGAAPDALPRAAPAPLAIEGLRRRLDEVLAGRGRVAAGERSELRVVSANSVLPVPPRDGKAGRGLLPGPGAAATAAHAASPTWHYGDGPGGPRQWGRLKPEFAACANGQRQSPIDIREGLALDLEPLQFDYRPGAFRVLDNGHTVQVDVAPGSALVAGGRRYALQQFHFHRPSEERIDGRRYDMDVHLVHRDDEGRLAVVAVLLERGAALPVLQSVWNHLPLERHEASTPALPLDPAELLPADRRYYTYMGSLTTPPCGEGVLWFVLQQPVSVAERQIDIFARLYPMNARPLQAAAGRLIKQSN